MWVIEDIVEIICMIKLQVQGQFLAFIIIDLIVSVFFKATLNTRLAFKQVIAKYLNFFYARMLAFLFTMIHYSISKY